MMDRRSTDRRNVTSTEVNIPDISELLQILYKHRKVMMPIIIVPIIFTFIYLKTKPKEYRATTSVILENQSLNSSDFQDIMAGMKFDNLTVPTQVEVISSPSLARETIHSLAIHHDAKEKLVTTAADDIKAEKVDIPYRIMKDFRKNLHVEQQGTSRLIEISFDSHAAETAATIVNKHARHYVMSHIRGKRQQAEKLNRWVSSEIVRLKNESIEKSRAVQKFKSDNGMVQGLNSEDLIYEQISDIVKQLSPIETRELDLQARVELIEKNKSGEITEVIQSDLIQSLKSRTSIATQKLQSLRADYGVNHPTVISAQKEVAQIQGDIRREISNIKRAIENELKTAQQQKKLLNKKLTELQKRADSFQEKRITLQSLQLEESASHKQLDHFLARSEEINSQIDFNRPDVRIVSFSDVPGEPKGSKKALILIAITMLSTMMACCVVFFREIMQQGIQRKEDVKKELNIRLLGTLPDERKPLMRILSKERSLFVEEIKRIYIHLSTNKDSKTILFTSARSGEGKSVIAASLAYYLHSIGKRTLLIDANTLKPQLADITETPNTLGFYEILAHTHNLDEIIQQSNGGADIITSGDQNAFSSDLLVAGHFTEQLERLKGAYDYIILDTASALDVSDADILARLSDEVVIVASWSKTPKKLLKKVSENLRALSQNGPSIILNKVPSEDVTMKTFQDIIEDMKVLKDNIIRMGENVMKKKTLKTLILGLSLSIICALIISQNVQAGDPHSEQLLESSLTPENFAQDASRIEPGSGYGESTANDPYRLNAGDHLRIFVFGVDDLTGEFRVDRKGRITMPLIGEIEAEGLGKRELENIITSRLIQEGYYNDPKVTVEIVALKPFYILGEVKNPGSYEYEPDLDVFKAIAIAGGYTPRASKNKVIITRKVHGEKVRIKANEDTPILPGDALKVKQRFF